MSDVIEDFRAKARERAAKTGKRIESDLTAEEVKQLAEGQRIWVNAFHCIRPTEAFLADIGRSVLQYLDDSQVVDDIIWRSKITYIRINKS